jgi:hypothetical protein
MGTFRPSRCFRSTSQPDPFPPSPQSDWQTDLKPPLVSPGAFSLSTAADLVPVHLCRHAAGMELDSYWRTRTVAEAMRDGYSHLRATCSGCGRITDIPWKLLLRPPRITVESFLGNLPLKCQRCGDTAPIIGVKRNASS